MKLINSHDRLQERKWRDDIYTDEERDLDDPQMVQRICKWKLGQQSLRADLTTERTAIEQIWSGVRSAANSVNLKSAVDFDFKQIRARQSRIKALMTESITYNTISQDVAASLDKPFRSIFEANSEKKPDMETPKVVLAPPQLIQEVKPQKLKIKSQQQKISLRLDRLNDLSPFQFSDNAILPRIFQRNDLSKRSSIGSSTAQTAELIKQSKANQLSVRELKFEGASLFEEFARKSRYGKPLQVQPKSNQLSLVSLDIKESPMSKPYNLKGAKVRLTSLHKLREPVEAPLTLSGKRVHLPQVSHRSPVFTSVTRNSSEQFLLPFSRHRLLSPLSPLETAD